MGVRATDVYAEEPEILADLRRAASSAEPFDREMTYRPPDVDGEFRLHVTYVPVPPDLVMVHLDDVTAQRELEEDLRSTIERLRRLDRERRRLLEDLMTVQEEERRRIALDIHDDLVQRLTALGLRVDAAGRAGGDQPTDELRRIGEEIRDAITRARQFALDLHPESLERAQLSEAVARTIAHWIPDAVRTTVEDRLEGPPPPEVAAHAFRIVREAIVNVRKHAHAKQVTVELARHGDDLLMRVGDDGVGFDPNDQGDAEQLGLLGIARRVELLGGSLSIDAAPGAGTRIEVRLPWDGPDRGADGAVHSSR
jgi:signal transduction histidine kinase